MLSRDVEARFERIEATLEATAKLQRMMEKQFGEGLIKLQTTVGEMAGVVTRYVDASDARMKQMEANLDALIRAITAEHSNGRKQ